jgi:hypothetical protein
MLRTALACLLFISFVYCTEESIFVQRQVDSIFSSRTASPKLNARRFLRQRLNTIMAMEDEDLSDVFSTVNLISDDLPAAYFAQDAYANSAINGNLPASNSQWINVLSTNINNRWAVTKVYTNKKDTVVVSYKGTNTEENFATNILSVIKTDCEINDIKCGKVALGFYELFKADIDQVRAAVEPYIKKGFKLVITGHSLGGASATFSAFYFATAFPKYPKPSLITFAAPRVGTSDFVSVFNTYMQNAVVRRFVTTWKSFGLALTDFVTELPPGYKHVGSTEIKVACPSSTPLSCHQAAAYIEGMVNSK